MAARPSPIVCAALCVTTALSGAEPPLRPASPAPPDLILTGGKVFTADSAHPWAEAVAIRGDRIMAVGTDAEVGRLGTEATRRIALNGRVVIPGINDAHDHLGAVQIGVGIRTTDAPTPTQVPRSSWIPFVPSPREPLRARGSRSP